MGPDSAIDVDRPFSTPPEDVRGAKAAVRQHEETDDLVDEETAVAVLHLDQGGQIQTGQAFRRAHPGAGVRVGSPQADVRLGNAGSA